MAKTKKIKSVSVEPIDLFGAKITLETPDITINGNYESLIVQRSDSGFQEESSIAKEYSNANTISTVINANPLTIEHNGDLFTKGDIVHLYHPLDIYDTGRHIVAEDTFSADGMAIHGAAYVTANGYHFIIGGWRPNNGANGDGNGAVSSVVYRSTNGVDWETYITDARFGKIWATAINRNANSFYFFGGHTTPPISSDPEASPTYYDNLYAVEIDVGGAWIIFEYTANAAFEGDRHCSTGDITSNDRYLPVIGGYMNGAPTNRSGYIHKSINSYVPSGFNCSRTVSGGLAVNVLDRNCTITVGGDGDNFRSIVRGAVGNQKAFDAFDLEQVIRIKNNTRYIGYLSNDEIELVSSRSSYNSFHDVATRERIEPISMGVSDYDPRFAVNVDVIGVQRRYEDDLHHVAQSTGTSLVATHNMDLPAAQLHIEIQNNDGEIVEPVSVTHNDTNTITATFATSDTYWIYVTGMVEADTAGGTTEGWYLAGSETGSTNALLLDGMGLNALGHHMYMLNARESNTEEMLDPVFDFTPPYITHDFISATDSKVLWAQTVLPENNNDALHRDRDFTNPTAGSFPVAGLDYMTREIRGGVPTIYAIASEDPDSQSTTGLLRSMDSTDSGVNNNNFLFKRATFDVGKELPDSKKDSAKYLYRDTDKFRSLFFGNPQTYFTQYQETTPSPDGTSWDEFDPTSLDGTDNDVTTGVVSTKFHTEQRLSLATGWKIGKGSNSDSGVEVIYNSKEFEITVLTAPPVIEFYDYGLDRLALPGAVRVKAGSTSTKMIIDIPSSWGPTLGLGDFELNYFAGMVLAIATEGFTDQWTYKRTLVERSSFVSVNGGELVLTLDPDYDIGTPTTDDFVYITHPIKEKEQYITAGISSQRTASQADDPAFLTRDLDTIEFTANPGLGALLPFPDAFKYHSSDDVTAMSLYDDEFADPSTAIRYNVTVRNSDDAVTVSPPHNGALDGKRVRLFDFSAEPKAITLARDSDYYFGKKSPGTKLPSQLRTDRNDKFARLLAMEGSRNRVIASQMFLYKPELLTREQLIELCRTYAITGHEGLDEDVLRRMASRYYSEVSQYRATLQSALNLYNILFDVPVTNSLVAYNINSIGPLSTLIRIPGGTHDRLAFGRGTKIRLLNAGVYTSDKYTVIDVDSNSKMSATNPNGTTASGPFSPDVEYDQCWVVEKTRPPPHANTFEINSEYALGVGVGPLSNAGYIGQTGSLPTAHSKNGYGYVVNSGQGANPDSKYPAARPGDFLYFIHNFGKLSTAYQIKDAQPGTDPSTYDYALYDPGVVSEVYGSIHEFRMFTMDPVTHNRFQFFLATMRKTMPHYISDILVNTT